ncbi:hypothetical protein GCM10022198_07270 [Klugiella xanthotipulae]
MGVAWWGSWGTYDFNQLAQDVRLHRCVNPLPMPHRNLKEVFAETQGVRKRPGLGEAVRVTGLTFSGFQHRGIDAARNIARILPWTLEAISRCPNQPRLALEG